MALATDTNDLVDPDERMCALTRTHAPRHDLLRFVASPDGVLTPDLKQTLPGRGAWLQLSRASLAEAIKRNVFARALKSSVEIPAGLENKVSDLLKSDALSVLSLAAKAGQIVAGFEKVQGLIKSGQVSVLLAATDGAEDGRRKLAGKFLANDAARKPRLIDCFSSGDLSLALGRTNVIHAAMRSGGLAEKFASRASRYEIFELNGAAKAES